MGNFNLFDFLNAVNNNPAAKNALDKIFSKNSAPPSESGAGKERLRPSNAGCAKTARPETQVKYRTAKPAAAKTPAAKPPRYSENALSEILKRHDALSKQIDEQNGGREKNLVYEKEKNRLTFPTSKI